MDLAGRRRTIPDVRAGLSVTIKETIVVTPMVAENLIRHVKPTGVDAAGLMLPDGRWPTGPSDCVAADTLRRFCNTVNPESGAERFRSIDNVEQWWATELSARFSLGDTPIHTVVALREELRDWLATGAGAAGAAGVVGAASEGQLAKVFSTTPMQAILTSDGPTLVAAADSGFDRLAGELIAAVFHAQHVGALRHVKVCANDHCRWVFYDTSRNHSGRWCSMLACGSRLKARTYRQRLAAGAG